MKTSIDITVNNELKQWLNRNKQAFAERWLRYADIRQGEFVRFTPSKTQQLNYIAVECLETFFKKEPSEMQIAKMEKWLKQEFDLSSYLTQPEGVWQCN